MEIFQNVYQIAIICLAVILDFLTLREYIWDKMKNLEIWFDNIQNDFSLFSESYLNKKFINVEQNQEVEIFQ